MEKIPMEWVDKIFHCLELFYGERFTRLFDTPSKQAIYKTIWSGGLTGLTYDQIKSALIELKKEAREMRNLPPHHLEFYRLAKRH